jgi:xylan 1,4-beta-xylosidase
VKIIGYVVFLTLAASLQGVKGLAAEPSRPPTYCNPLDLAYRFELDLPSRRSAADPTAIYFHGQYWIFASKVGGFLHSPDFIHWSLVVPSGLDLEAWAPTVEVINDHLYFATENTGIYRTDDPELVNWTLVSKGLDVGHDEDLFLDEDDRLYLYTGSARSPIRGEELDVKHDFQPIGSLAKLLPSDAAHRGWEVRTPPAASTPTAAATPTAPAPNAAADMAKKMAPYIEGAWMNKFAGRYYLQYAAPDTKMDTYGDGVFVSNHPLGPFTYQPYSPFSFKPTGFARGAGHGSTFKDAKGNYWHIASIVISRRHKFERRLGVYPARFFPDSQLACNTYLGDYPQYPPGVADDPFTSNSPGWMLLSLKKPVTASSELPGHPARLAVDEDLHDWWSAATGDSQEWIKIDLGSVCRIDALQLNFADEGSTQLGRLQGDAYRYLVEVSDDGKQWKTLLDRKDNTRDAPHDYTQLDAPAMGRYVRVTNLHTPAGARFSMSGLRIFGNAPGAVPQAVKEVAAQLNPADGRSAHVAWKPSPGAEFYIVRYGVKPDRLYSNDQVYDATSLDLNALNVGVPYFLTVDAVNASGITPGPAPIPIAP